MKKITDGRTDEAIPCNIKHPVFANRRITKKLNGHRHTFRDDNSVQIILPSF